MGSMQKTIDVVISGTVIKVSDFRDFDQLVTVLTSKGERLCFLAKSTKKIASKNRVACQLFSKGEYELIYNPKTHLYLLKRASFMINYIMTSTSIEAIAAYHFISDACFKAYDSIDDKIQFYDLVEACLTSLHATRDPYFVITYFLVRIYAMVGLQLVLDSCVQCHSKSSIVSFSSSKGGYICVNCNESRTIFDQDALRTLRLMNRSRHISSIHIESTTRFKVLYKEVFQVLVDYGHFYMKSLDTY